MFSHTISLKKTVCLSLACLLLGALFFAFYNNWIIFYMPSRKEDASSVLAHKKKVELWYMKHNSWQKEQKDIVLSGDRSQALQIIIEVWLTLLAEESIGKKRPLLESASLSLAGDELFLSFDRSPFSRDISTYEKLVWTEGLLKTVHAQDAALKKVRFLMHHQPLQDSSLDFSCSWPLTGFL